MNSKLSTIPGKEFPLFTLLIVVTMTRYQHGKVKPIISPKVYIDIAT